MKNLLLIFCIVLCVAFAKGQNLVPNPSFEVYDTCPDNSGYIRFSLGWSSYRGSPDYFNACANPNSTIVSVPNNFGGYQIAASGNAYAGFIPIAFLGPNTREIIGSQLTSPLIIGTKYYVAFKVAFSIGTLAPSNCASDKMGINFSTVPFDIFHPAPINNVAKVYTNTIITDTLNWIKIVGSFNSDSAYTYVMLGNFFDDAHTDTIKMMDYFEYVAYYYLDDICVSTDSSYAYNYAYMGIGDYTEIPSISLAPNPATNYIEILISNYTEPYSLLLYNVFGQVLVRADNINVSNARIDISHLSNGIYFLKIIYKNKIFNNKLIKQ